jgi:hypothetical protein
MFDVGPLRFLGFFLPGTDVMIFKIFLPIHLAKILAFWFKILLVFCTNNLNIGFQENRHFLRKKYEKNRLKLMIKLSTLLYARNIHIYSAAIHVGLSVLLSCR